MSSGDAFQHVKALLGKLDRSIDEARARRTGVNDDDQGEQESPSRAEGHTPQRESSGRAPVGGSNGVSGPGGIPGTASGTRASGANGESAMRREGTATPPGASPTNSNPTRRPGIGRARPLNRPSAPENTGTRADDDEAWVGREPESDD